MRKIRIQYNSPVVLTFCLLCCFVLLLDDLSAGWTTERFFCVYRSSLSDPYSYIRLFCHVLGHSSWEHLSNNILMILFIGPPLEERYGSTNILISILLTAFAAGLAQCIFFPGVGVLGASGIVFMMILLASMGGMRDGHIPLTLILVAIFYLGGEAFNGIYSNDNISQLSHIIGGICGGVFGYVMRHN